MKRKICINVNPGFKGVTFDQCLDALKVAGFDGVFTGWHVGDMKNVAKKISDRGLYFQSVHAPFTDAHKPWEKGKAGDDVIDNLINCLRESAEAGAPIVVVHPIIGMDRHNPTDLGIERYGRLVREAEKLGIKVAFENVEGIEYLEKIIADLGSSPAIGYCWDSATPWTAARQAPLSWSLLRFASIELVMLSNHLILCCSLLLLPSIFYRLYIHFIYAF